MDSNEKENKLIPKINKKISDYISNRYRSNNECKQHNEVLTLMHIILSYRMGAKYKERLIKK